MFNKFLNKFCRVVKRDTIIKGLDYDLWHNKNSLSEVI